MAIPVSKRRRDVTMVPVAGQQFRRAARLGLEGPEAKLLCLLAAYADAGHQRPALAQLGAPLGGMPWHRVCRLLERLEARGLIQVKWATDEEQRMRQHNTYTLMLGGPNRQEEDR